MRRRIITTIVIISLLSVNLGACTQTPDKPTTPIEQTKLTPTPLPAASSSEGKRIIQEKLARLNKLLNTTAEDLVKTEDDKKIKDLLPTDRQRKADMERLKYPCIFSVAIENSNIQIIIAGCRGTRLTDISFEANVRDLNPEGISIRDNSIIVPCKEDKAKCVSFNVHGVRGNAQLMKIIPHNLSDIVDAKDAERYRLTKPGVIKEISDLFSQVIGIAQK